ncbi:MAG: hypothetical protein HBSIN02_16060 [Bacteroidia bacterium]|nr:MAG: hypothetical protein HBSIN02_16060 [Bacteroidia bacterium]
MRESLRIGFLVVDPKSLSSEEQSAWDWLVQRHPKSVVLTMHDAGHGVSRDAVDVIWWHQNRFVTLPASALDSAVRSSILRFVRSGGGLFLTLLAAPFVADLGLEPVRPNMVRRGQWNEESWAPDYPDIRGFGGLQGHPVFFGLEGAVFTWNPIKTSPYAGAFYAGEVPQRGRIVAVERQYIRLNEQWRMITEYAEGRGTVLCAGSHLYFGFPANRFRLHLEHFTSNCLSYVSNPSNYSGSRTYWSFNPRTVREVTIPPSDPVHSAKQTAPSIRSGLFLHRDTDEVSNAFFDVGGKRILIMGKEQSGIDEVWSHPFRLLRRLRTAIRVAGGSIQWLDQHRLSIEISPESVRRTYAFGEMRMEEVIAGSHDRPGGIVRYEILSHHPLELILTGSVDLRYMWPHSDQATGSLQFGWDEGLRAYIITNDGRTMTAVVGMTETPSARRAGPCAGYDAVGGDLKPIPTDLVEAGFAFRVRLDGLSSQISFAFSGSEDLTEALETYRHLTADPVAVESEQALHFRDLFAERTVIRSPDPDFNDGYRWALAATDRFLVTTRSLGTSLMAGFGTTDRGWDGGQKVSGRPGYAWYFGRDACWTAFAMLAYGDHESVRSVLKFLGDHQDLNGKILHELTTSGHVHYDAADSTPLYAILFGRYLRATGDLEFARTEFPRLRKAIEFCRSTDTDGDGLMENTNVGHGWVEGGKLFPAHVELYLAACWASALEEAAYVAERIGQNRIEREWKGGIPGIRKAINERFWNEETGFFNFALRRDGSFNAEKTILPAVAVLLGWTDPEKAEKCLEHYASSDFTADWGVRIMGKSNPSYNPRGYHSGSVWPLFTGWAALAEFAGKRYLQGFAHVLGTMMVARHWAAGYVEEVLNGDVFQQGGVCSHQAWSESMVLQPLLEGMLGIRFDAASNAVALRPFIPPQWSTCDIASLRVGGHLFDLLVTRSDSKTEFLFRQRTPGDLAITLTPVLPAGAAITSCTINGTERGIAVPMMIPLRGEARVVIAHTAGIALVPPVPHYGQGETSDDLRVLTEKFDETGLEVLVEGIAGKGYELQFLDPERMVRRAQNGELEDKSKGLRAVHVSIPGSDGQYRRSMVKLLT